ncbi:Gp15 family bacteriophage protein [Bacillus hominis]|uniref:Gp15 family bacteriophage protein n=1 Tax=Bacillus hominis TaxID=2817478 RepID=A0ABT7R155_9BACI|nr:Gp15 family bacteriophage protein [Bacillus hominis]MDM5191135.1 Gp15 family bacteriophage protein [Bacillus hominis]MDM5436655.1 Gp15 family bacteriophage protein [Bacillus hominis]
MFSLTERENDFYTWHGVRLELNLSFDNIMLLLELLSDEDVDELARITIALQMLIVDNSVLSQLDMERRSMLFMDILKARLDIDLKTLMNNDKKEDEDEKLLEPPIVDFTIDAERIFSSFLFDYNIDLIKQQGKMQWNKFLALFRNLSEKSPMGQALHYRTCETPPKDKHNNDERKRIKKMKELYELPKAKEIREQREFIEFQKRMEAKKAMIEGR